MEGLKESINRRLIYIINKGKSLSLFFIKFTDTGRECKKMSGKVNAHFDYFVTVELRARGHMLMCQRKNVNTGS